MEERLKFIAAYLEGEWTMSELWRAYGISRPTGYEVLARYQAHGLDGVRERSRAAQHHPNQMAPALAEQVVQARHAHPRWGPRKLRAWMARKQPDVPWPAPSPIGTLLTRHGLVAPRRRVRRPPAAGGPGATGAGPNDVWCADFKGWFRTGDGRRCEPLTISDECSRFLLTCRAVERPDWEHTYPLFHRAFCAYGVPRAIRTDPRAPVCQPRGGRAVAPGAVVDQAGHPPATDRAGQAPAKRAPRAHAPDLEAGRGPAAPRLVARATTRPGSLSPRVQLRAAASRHCTSPRPPTTTCRRPTPIPARSAFTTPLTMSCATCAPTARLSGAASGISSAKCCVGSSSASPKSPIATGTSTSVRCPWPRWMTAPSNCVVTRPLPSKPLSSKCKTV